MKLLLVTLATCLALHSACSQAGPVTLEDPVNSGAMDVSKIGMALEDLQHLLEIKTNLTRVQRAEIQRLQQDHMESNKEKNDQLAAKDAIIDLHIAENAKLSDILKKESNLKGEQNEVSNPGGSCAYECHCNEDDGQTFCCSSQIPTSPAQCSDHVHCPSFPICYEKKTEDHQLSGSCAYECHCENDDKQTFCCSSQTPTSPAQCSDHAQCPSPPICYEKKAEGCESGWKPFGDKCYKVFSEVLTTYNDAIDMCSSVHADVAALETREENDFTKLLLEQGQLPGGGHFWLSGRRKTEDSPYVWGTGEEMVFNDWQGGQPQRRSEWCMSIYKNDQQQISWYTEDCNYGSHDNGVLCEKTEH